MDHEDIVLFIAEEIESLTLLCHARPQQNRLLDEDEETLDVIELH